MASDFSIATLHEQVDGLNAEAWQLRVSDSSQSYALSKKAVELAREAGYEKGLAEGLRTYGFGLIRLSRHNEARLILEEAFSLFEKLGDERRKSEVYEYFGIIYRSLGNFDASLENLLKALDISLHENFKEETSLAYYHLGVTCKYLGNFEQAFVYLLESLRVAREINYWVSESYALNLIGQLYFETNDYQQALVHYQQSLEIRKASGDLWGEAGCLDNIGFTYYKLGSLEDAVHHCLQSLSICQSTGDKKGQANTLFHLSEMFYQQGEHTRAIAAANESLQIREDINDKKGQAEVLLYLAEISHDAGTDATETMKLLGEALTLGNETKSQDLLAKIHYRFYRQYKQLGQVQQALESFEIYNEIERELHKDALAEKVINLKITHRVEQAQKETESYRSRHAELAALFEELTKQKEETERQKQKAEQALEDLRSTQAQLIQREKMASLGELTAGIAHEIQNPLNFVNNFAGVNQELLAEIKQEIEKANFSEVRALVFDLEANEEKIIHHGRRADGIVKGMLQHARASSGKKEPTNINGLADEYLRLSYQGMRAKDNTFNTVIKTKFDDTINDINIVPQDIGRVLLNLFNNAFYAVQEKKKQLQNGYEPTVSVSTQRKDGKVIITVADNGTGIPKKALDKIFQPFFTTKPTGEGTGLGLSLSYDIITKGHGGTLSVHSTEEEGSEFMVMLHMPEHRQMSRR